MRKLLLLILVVGVAYLVYQRQIASSGTRLSFPTVAAWRHTPASAQFVETASILGDRWRVEISGGRSPLVAVFDGTSFASTNPKATAQQLDPRVTLQQIYASLPSTASAPIERVGAADCWHFTDIKANTAGEVWIDTQTHFVRKVALHTNGSDSTDTYEFLLLNVEAEAKRLFDTKNLQVILPR